MRAEAWGLNHTKLAKFRPKRLIWSKFAKWSMSTIHIECVFSFVLLRRFQKLVMLQWERKPKEIPLSSRIVKPYQIGQTDQTNWAAKRGRGAKVPNRSNGSIKQNSPTGPIWSNRPTEPSGPEWNQQRRKGPTRLDTAKKIGRIEQKWFERQKGPKDKS